MVALRPIMVTVARGRVIFVVPVGLSWRAGRAVSGFLELAGTASLFLAPLMSGLFLGRAVVSPGVGAAPVLGEARVLTVGSTRRRLILAARAN
jgi:hypothetical protein